MATDTRLKICRWMVWVQLALLPMLAFTLSAQSVEARCQTNICYPSKDAILIITTRKPYNKVGAVLDHAMPNLNIKPHQDKGGKR